MTNDNDRPNKESIRRRFEEGRAVWERVLDALARDSVAWMKPGMHSFAAQMALERYCQLGRVAWERDVRACVRDSEASLELRLFADLQAAGITDPSDDEAIMAAAKTSCREWLRDLYSNPARAIELERLRVVARGKGFPTPLLEKAL